MSADVSQLADLAGDLEKARLEVVPVIAPVVARGAVNIKKDWRANAVVSAGKHARAYPYSIGYDLEDEGLTAVIGPDKDKSQGPLGNLIEYGSANNPPHNDGGRALSAEGPRFAAEVTKATRRLL